MHEREKNTEALTRDVYIHLLGSWLEERFEANVEYSRESLQLHIAYNRKDECFEFTDIGEGNGKLIIERKEDYKLTCLVKP